MRLREREKTKMIVRNKSSLGHIIIIIIVITIIIIINIIINFNGVRDEQKSGHCPFSVDTIDTILTPAIRRGWGWRIREERSALNQTKSTHRTIATELQRIDGWYALYSLL